MDTWNFGFLENSWGNVCWMKEKRKISDSHIYQHVWHTFLDQKNNWTTLAEYIFLLFASVLVICFWFYFIFFRFLLTIYLLLMTKTETRFTWFFIYTKITMHCFGIISRSEYLYHTLMYFFQFTIYIHLWTNKRAIKCVHVKK